MQLQPQQRDSNIGRLSSPAHSAKAARVEGRSEESGVENSQLDNFESSASEIEDRQIRSLQLLQDPSPLSRASESLLGSAWESAQSFTRNLVGHFFYGEIPQPLPAEESRVRGVEETKNLIAEHGESDDPALTERLKKAVDMAQAALPQTRFTGQMVVLDTDDEHGSVQADGSLLLSKGLISELSDEELLFVVGHELGHQQEHDNATRLAYEQRLATAKTAGAQAYFAQRMSEFYHGAESRADDYGVRVLEHHGIGKEHAVGFFLRRMDGFEGGEPASFTHPSDAKRAWEILS